MRRKMRITDKSIKDKSMIMREGCRGISSVTALFLMLIGCNSHSPKQQVEPNLSFIDTIVNDESGDSLRREIGMMKDSLKEGLWISFYPDGCLEGIEFFEDGKLNGPWYLFHENGQLFAYRGTKNGGFHGEGYNYFSDGTLMSKIRFINDQQDGMWEEYDENGNLIHIWEYQKGEYIRTISGNPPLIEE